MGGRWTGLSGLLPQQENWEAPWLSQQEREAQGTLAQHRGCLISAFHPPALHFTAQSPGPWASLDRISKADNKRHLV